MGDKEKQKKSISNSGLTAEVLFFSLVIRNDLIRGALLLRGTSR